MPPMFLVHTMESISLSPTGVSDMIKSTSDDRNKKRHDKKVSKSKQPANLRQEKKKRIVVTGRNKITDQSIDKNFSVVTKKVWVHVGRVKLGTPTEQIKKYLGKNFLEQNFQVELLPK